MALPDVSNRPPGPPEKMFRRSPEVTETRVTDRVILYHASDGGAFVLNPTASILWDALATPCTMSRLVDELHGRFPGLTPDRAEADITSCMLDLQRLRVIEVD
ncbi:MAG TPA: PqqD family protein [Gemmatimonadaceae bacterium]|jgi:hypothetical protein|nr:PqqD family protein [Gemmatimonadaceae bacterium]